MTVLTTTSAVPTDDPAVTAYRQAVRSWFEARSTPAVGASYVGEGIDLERSRAWQRRLSEAGLAGVAWPTAYGGGGGAAWQEAVVRQEAAQFADSADDVFGTGSGLVGPALLVHGTEKQKAAHLRSILAGDEVWCQLFSEPDAGSDLASLTTRAVPEGEGWVVDGRKVWSSAAHLADFGLLLARTGDRPGHRGISCFLLPMRSPGVEVLPLRQLTGDAHFCQVFLGDVRLGPEALLGEVDGGWAVTRTVLAQERVLVAAGNGVRLPVDQLVGLAQAGRLDLSGSRRDRVVQAMIRARLIELLSARLLQGEPPTGASVVKLAMATHVAATTDLAMELLGPSAVLGPDAQSPDEVGWQRAFLGQWLVRIGGGTEQIQRTIVGERMLGLPPEPPATRTTARSKQAKENR